MNNFSKDSIQKKKIAFILPQMNQGGPARDFLNICDIIDHNKNGILVNPKDPYSLANGIKSLINDPKFAFKLGKNLRKKIKIKFDSEYINNLTISKYKILFSSKK